MSKEKLKELYDKVITAEASEEGARKFFEECNEISQTAFETKVALQEYQKRQKDTQKAYVALTRAFIKYRVKEIL